MQVALKIDVDTHDGLRCGVPALAEMLTREGVAASFYVAMGPDNSGKAARRMVTNRGFLTKMFRTNAVAMYGWRTILSGTLLKARPIALAFPDLMRDLARRGFEVGVHGYDHVLWQDHVDTLGEAGLRLELASALENFRAIMGVAPRGFAAPGWRANECSTRLLEALELSYHSDTRGRAPYLPRVEVSGIAGGAVMGLPEIPTTLPTLDEVLGRVKLADGAAIADYFFEQMQPEALNVHTIHAETEGRSQLGSFTLLVRKLKAAGADFLTLEQVAASLERETLPVCALERKTLPGRSGWIAAQGPPERPSMAARQSAPA